MQITIIGMTDKKPSFSEEVALLIEQSKNFSGGKRHQELVSDILPKNTQWVNIVVPLENVYQAMLKEESWVVFASGDPLFYGIGTSYRNRFPDAEITIHPTFNSLQLLAHNFTLPYGEFQTISLTGRSWHKFDQALIQGSPRMGILTDRKNTPIVIAQRMLDFGYDNYKMYYGEYLGGSREKVCELTLPEALNMEIAHPNCLYLEMTENRIPRKGISEQDFEILPGRPKMITKLPYRLSTISLLDMHSKTVFWDVGACTGSVSVEVKLNFPHLIVHSFEIREISQQLIEQNAQKFQTPGINIHINDYLKVDKKNIEKPDVVFIGGHGNKLHEFMYDIDKYLTVGGLVSTNAVKEESKNQFVDWCNANNYNVLHHQKLSLNEFNPINIIVAQKPEK